MPVVAGFPVDVFVSYAHVDNDPIADDAQGWITGFVELLRAGLVRKAGRSDRIHVWHDPALRSNDVFDNRIADAISGSAVFLAVLSSGFFRTITELTPDNRKVRNPCSIEVICKNAGASLAEVSEVASSLSTRDRCFLFIPREPLVPGTLIDISHEALIRKWVRLDSWVMDEGRITGIFRTLEDSARRWRDFDGSK